MNDEELAGKWFRQVTKPQLDIYNETMRDIAPYRNSPRWERERKAASFILNQSNIEPGKIYQSAMLELMTDGEISEATWYAMDQFEVGQAMLEAAE